MADLPSVDPDASAEEKKETILKASKKRKQELDKKQNEILGEIQEEHGGELVETPVNIAGDYTATIKTKLNGELISRMGAVQDRLEAGEEQESLRDIDAAMDEAATILDGIIEESEYDKKLFFNVYDQEGPEALAVLIERVFDAIEKERERKSGNIDGFR